MSPTSTNLTRAKCAKSNFQIDSGFAALSGRLDASNMTHSMKRVQLGAHQVMSVVSLPANLVPSGNKLRRRIMIIGDDPHILFVASLLLASGYEILTVEDVRTALDAFASVSGISLVLLHCSASASKACKASVRLRARFPWLPIVRFGGKSESSGSAGRYFDYHHIEDQPIGNLIRTVHVLAGRSDCDGG